MDIREELIVSINGIVNDPKLPSIEKGTMLSDMRTLLSNVLTVSEKNALSDAFCAVMFPKNVYYQAVINN